MSMSIESGIRRTVFSVSCLTMLLLYCIHLCFRYNNKDRYRGWFPRWFCASSDRMRMRMQDKERETWTPSLSSQSREWKWAKKRQKREKIQEKMGKFFMKRGKNYQEQESEQSSEPREWRSKCKRFMSRESRGRMIHKIALEFSRHENIGVWCWRKNQLERERLFI